jgi:tRNA (cmo5U34)-methyltransferase
MSAIYDDAWAASYVRRATASIPGREGLYRLCVAHLSGVPAHARILVVGAGTGEELLHLGQALPHARFVALEPAEAMRGPCAARLEAAGMAPRVELLGQLLAEYDGPGEFDAATAILVSQHIPAAADAAAFFRQVHGLLRPGGRLYSADLHIARGQDRAAMLALWRLQAELSGVEPELLDRMLEAFARDPRPRDEAAIQGFLDDAGFVDVLKPFSSLLYGAWCARRPP